MRPGHVVKLSSLWGIIFTNKTNRRLHLQYELDFPHIIIDTNQRPIGSKQAADDKLIAMTDDEFEKHLAMLFAKKAGII